MKKLIIFLCICFTSSLSFTQTVEDCITDLENILFGENLKKVYLSSYLNKFDCEKTLIKNDVLIRENQPNPEIIGSILSNIVHYKDPEVFDDIYDIYKRHIVNFKKEWSEVYVDNYYSCNLVQDQYAILTSFEYSLKALKYQVEKTSAEEILENHFVEYILKHKIRNAARQDRRSLINEYNFISKHYENLNPFGWYKGREYFHHLDPFMTELEPHFINKLENCKWQNGNDFSCLYIWENREFIYRIKNEKIVNYFLTNFHLWKQNKREIFIYKYAGKNYNERLSKFLVEELVSKDRGTILKAERVKPILRKFFYDERNLIHTIDKIIEFRKKSEDTKIELKDLPYNRTMNYLNNLKISDVDYSQIIDVIINEITKN